MNGEGKAKLACVCGVRLRGGTINGRSMETTTVVDMEDDDADAGNTEDAKVKKDDAINRVATDGGKSARSVRLRCCMHIMTK